MLFMPGRRGCARARPCSLSGSLSKTAAPSGGIVTSDTVTVTVPGGNGGGITFGSFSTTGSVTTQYSKNGAAFGAIVDGGGDAFASGDTLAVRGTGMTAGEAWTFTLTDNTSSSVIGTYTITAS